MWLETQGPVNELMYVFSSNKLLGSQESQKPVRFLMTQWLVEA